MMLARAEVAHPARLRADLQQYYGLNLDDMGAAYTVEHAAALVAQLPPGARVAAAESPAAEWEPYEYVLAAIEFRLRAIEWHLAGGRGDDKPRPMETPAVRERRRRKVAATDREFVDEILEGGNR